MNKLNKLRTSRFLFSLFLIMQAGLQVQAQKAGTYRGNFSGDLTGTFEFTINNAHYANLEGKFKASDGTVKIIYGRLDPKGVIDAFFYDKQIDVTSSMTRGTFRGNVNGNNCSGSYEVYDATAEKASTSKGSWSSQAIAPDEGILSYSYLLGKDLPFSEDKPVALRIHISLNGHYRNNFSIQTVTLGFRDPVPGRYAADVDPIDNFYVYTDEDGLFLTPRAGAKEADYDFPFASFGTKQALSLPKAFTAKIHVTLKSEIGEKNREEVLIVPVQITSLCNVLVQKCGYGEYPALNNKKLTKGQGGTAVSGDELLIPMDAEVWIKFLDGTLSYFANKSQTPWRLVMNAGHFSSNQNWSYTENAITIKGMAAKGIETGGDKIADKALEEGLQMLVRKSASVSAPGLILQVSQFFGAGVAGGEPVAIKMRSKLDIMFYANGTFRIRNLEGSPEVWRKQSTPLLIPIGKEVTVNRKGVMSEPAPISKIEEQIVERKVETVNWQGEWQTKYGWIKFVQNGDKVTATYEHDKGKLEGTIKGKVLSGTWSEAPTYLPPKDGGIFEFVMSADGKSFTGRWKDGNTGDWQTGWDGVIKKPM